MSAKNLESGEYLLPFDTSKYPIRISQGNDGPWSHKVFRTTNVFGRSRENSLRYAVDFALPLGTEVRAARAGKILIASLANSWCYEGLDPNIGLNPPPDGWTNFVLIAHSDDTFALYSHLGTTQLIDLRQEVKAGDAIAVTGKSGWIAQIPHLHFQVSSRNVSESVPFSFRDYEGSLDHQTLLSQGQIWLGDYP